MKKINGKRNCRNFFVNNHWWHTLKGHTGEYIRGWFMSYEGWRLVLLSTLLNFRPLPRQKGRTRLFCTRRLGQEKKFQSPAKQAFANVIKVRPAVY